MRFVIIAGAVNIYLFIYLVDNNIIYIFQSGKVIGQNSIRVAGQVIIGKLGSSLQQIVVCRSRPKPGLFGGGSARLRQQGHKKCYKLFICMHMYVQWLCK